ncbi:hypothetical protein VB711_22820 [Cronbergia sp. UHCC 0137]|uniref:hypothetical protein n=1 Tax=Cronbergia sp. UHCC 0137 TaxID=3110239 RepID=UPI002B2048CD|nr:hypothetical protein [Cronbergia sp. UHCC 0137]MEA5620650.1 hypothetical protein [Cronbergia sp. UHCC 0137]
MEIRLFDEPLVIDEGALEQRANEDILIDQRIRLLAQENRLGLSRGATKRELFDRRTKAILDIPFQVIAHAHPECRFHWVRLTIDFSSTTDAIIRDLSPREVLGSEPVKISTKHTGGLSFEVEQVKLSPQFKFEKSMEHQIYFPEITSSGAGFSSVQWNFQALSDRELHVDRELRILVSFPASVRRLEANFSLRSRISIKGWAGLIPVMGRKRIVVETFEHID